MTTQIAVRIPNAALEEIDVAVAAGSFGSRADAVRTGLNLALQQLRSREIAAEYAAAYANTAQEEWVGEAGASGAAEVLGGEPPGSES